MKKFSLVIFSICLIACDLSPKKYLDKGTWGSEDAQLIVMNSEVILQFTCASGLISNAIVLEKDNTFITSGTYSQSSGAPPMDENYNKLYPAIYKGRVDGNSLTLTIDVDSLKIENLTYYLSFGNEKEIPICP